MKSRKKLKKEIKDMEEECYMSKVKACDFLDGDHDLEVKKIRDALNYEYELELKKRDKIDSIDDYNKYSTSKDLSIFEKGLLAFANGIIKANDAIKKKWDIDIIEKMGARAQKEEEWAQKHPFGNIAKQLGKGTLKGVGGDLIGGLAGEIVDKVRKK